MLKGILFVLLFIVSISFIPLKFYLRFYRKPNDSHVILLIKIWRIPFSFQINNLVTRIFWSLSKNRFWEKQPPPDLQAKQIVWERLFPRLFLFRQIFSTVFQETMSTLHKIAMPIKIKKIRLHTEVALQDAAQTALAVGIFWWTWGIIYSQIDRYFNISKTTNDLAIIPNYRKQQLLIMDFSCILEFPLGHIIIIIYYLFKNAEKIRRLLRRVSQ